MFDIDLKKIKSLKNKHWAWFWYMAGKKEIEIQDKEGTRTFKYAPKDFWRIFFKWDEENIKKILFPSKEEMAQMVDENSQFMQNYQSNLSRLKEFFNTTKDSMEKLLWESFGYTNFKKQEIQKPNDGKWGAYEFVKALDINVCPYCGRNYIFTIGDNQNKNGRPEIDHFFPEQEYPFLSCSLYNFVPSCPQCNHQKHDDYNKKKDGEIKLIPYPYINHSKGERTPIKFRVFYKIEDENLIYGVRIREKGTTLDEKFLNANKAFHLEDLYEMHEIEINDLFLRYRIYNNPKINEIKGLFLSTEDSIVTKLLFNRKLKSLILGLPVCNGNKIYPLKKFKEDIIDQMDKAKNK